ncbi:MAG: hypothetical protein R3B53_01275 [Candidatus Paceibacterota bacterium]
MPKITEPTARQITTLQELGLIPPPTRNSCFTMIEWLNRHKSTVATRAEQIKSLQMEWLGKRVQSMIEKDTGVVIYISPLPDHAGHTKFNAIVEWDNGRTKATATTTLRLLAER